MNKTELAKAVAAKVEGATNKQAGEFVEAVFDAIKDTLAEGEEVNVAGFAKFSVVETSPRVARNLQTGEEIQVPAGKKVKVKVLKGLKEVVKS